MPERIYADTSVFGGVFDAAWETPTRQFFDEITKGRFRLCLSTAVLDELALAPPHVRQHLAAHRPQAELLALSDAVLELQQAYLAARILTPKWEVDALHVAAASAHRCAMIVSWNFSHIVHTDKIPLYNAVNVRSGYDPIVICNPAEVLAYYGRNGKN